MLHRGEKTTEPWGGRVLVDAGTEELVCIYSYALSSIYKKSRKAYTVCGPFITTCNEVKNGGARKSRVQEALREGSGVLLSTYNSSVAMFLRKRSLPAESICSPSLSI